MRGVFFNITAAADVGDLLKFLHSAVAICGGKHSVFIKTFAVLDVDILSFYGIM